jgi:ADP-heptose:LPS heptosyltransferase
MPGDSLAGAMEGGRALYCSAYTGLGDALLLGPILRELCARYPGRVFYPENPVLDLYRRLAVAGLRDLRAADAQLRRILDPLGPALLAFLAENRIGAVLNFRRDALQHGDAYRRGAAALAARGLYVSDLCSETPPEHHQTAHVAELAREYLAGIGVELERPADGWLRAASPLLRAAARDPGSPVVLYTGAGQVHKRIEPGFWLKLATDLQGRGHERLIVLAGVSAAERADARALTRALAAADIDHRLLVGSDLLEVAILLARSSAVVSCDTFIVHLCSALDVPLVGLYPATSAAMYGPGHERSTSISSAFYATCPWRNAMGNCDAWELGCADTPCHDDLAPDKVADEVTHLLARAPGPGRSGPIARVLPCLN